MKSRLLPMLVAALACLVPVASLAMTECASKVTSIFAGDGGRIYIGGSAGPSGYFDNSNPNQRNALALSTSALLADKVVKWRFAADNVDCSSPIIRDDLVGIWLLK